MARLDLQELRASIRSTGFLTVSESRNLDYYGESRLLELLDVFGAVFEADDEYYEGTDDGGMYDFTDVRSLQHEYADELDVFDFWDIEITCEYDET